MGYFGNIDIVRIIAHSMSTGKNEDLCIIFKYISNRLSESWISLAAYAVGFLSPYNALADSPLSRYGAR